MSNAVRQRETYEAVVTFDEAPFIDKRPALFSPAAATQDEANTLGWYGRFAQILIPTEYTSWTEESVAHVRSCYIGDWTSLNKVRLEGPGALPFLSQLGMRDLSRFEPGQIKHHVQLDENGWVASEGVLCRLGESAYMYTAGSCDWLRWQLSLGDWDAELTDISPDQFIFGVQGPNSLSVLEQATGESLRDVAFCRSRQSAVAGCPVRVLRTGISGELGYELHGPTSGADEVWEAIVQAGEAHGIKQLGLRSQPVQHIEAGIATNGLDYMPAASITPGAPRQFRRGSIGGSFVPTAFTDYFRKPGELGWAPRSGIPQHEFLGRDALVAEEVGGGPARTLVGLTWDAADVVAVFSSLFDGSGPADQMAIPRLAGPEFDQVLLSGEPVGVSSGRAVSITVGATISLCALAREHAAPGTELTIVWGRPGTAQREIRATVTELPFKPDHRRVDVAAL